MTLRALVSALLAAVAVAAPASAAPSSDPDLWATVNACDTPAHPAAMGVRVSVPARAHGAQQWVRIRVMWWSGSTKAWKALNSLGDSGFKRIGDGSGVAMGGTTFKFTRPAAGRYLIVRGLVDVQWRNRRGHTVSATRLRTMYGHTSAGDPLLGVSHGACLIHP